MPFTVIWLPYLFEYGESGVLDRIHDIVVLDNFNEFNEDGDNYLNRNEFENFISFTICDSSIDN